MSVETNTIKLTEYSRGSGCGCKIAPAVLREILKSDEEFPPFPHLLVGNESNDDAAVLDLNMGNDLCLISTTDFFMPVVNDAKEFGKIASVNALSDVYAMGGTPTLAVAILGWPIDKLPAKLASQVLEGARFICRLAGIPLAGGHSIDSAEPFFGLAVNGLVKKADLKKNNTAQEGDLLYITKPLGAGIMTTAHKRNLALPEDFETAIRYMTTLNKIGASLAKLKGVTALTDVTGFGLAGHLIEMCDKGRLSANLQSAEIPLMPNIQYYLDKMIYPDMTMKNFSAFSSQCSTMSASQLFTLCDPQTSGGLMVAVAPNAVDDYLQVVNDFGLQGIADHCIGKFTPPSEKTITIQ
jgi:selenide,water dikinase